MSFVIEPLQGQKTFAMGSDTLPSHPFRMVFYGPSEIAGKSTAIFSLLHNKFPYWNFYQKGKYISVMCPTVKDDNRWRLFIKEDGIQEDNVTDKWDEEFIVKLQKKMEKDGRPRLLIVDDLVPLPSKKMRLFTMIFTRGRHLGERVSSHGGLSIIATSQVYKGLPPAVRANSSNLALWLMSDGEVKKCWEEHSNGLSYVDWKKLYYYCTRQEYSFMSINYQNSDLYDGRFGLRFEKVLKIDRKENVESDTESSLQFTDGDDISDSEISFSYV